MNLVSLVAELAKRCGEIIIMFLSCDLDLDVTDDRNFWEDKELPRHQESENIYPAIQLQNFSGQTMRSTLCEIITGAQVARTWKTW